MENNSTYIQENAMTLSLELDWLSKLINHRLESHFSRDEIILNQIVAPELSAVESKYAKFLIECRLDEIERLIVVCCLATDYHSQVFDKFLIKNKGLDKRFTEFGGKIDEKNSRFLPTLETIFFIFFGKNFESRFKMQFIFDESHVFNKLNIIQFSNKNENDSLMSRTVTLSHEILQLITVGTKFKPDYSTNFPAKLLKTELDWKDLVLNPIIMDEVQNINTWLKYKGEINTNKELRKKINKGYKCLFYGPPGTGKTLTTSLIGKSNQKDVYRIDLSQVVSKYVGETEKNLAQIFNIAENKDWILFFDEAESLFSKRTSVGDSKDKFANQQTAYLLQRVEDYNGLIILATNLKPNIDMAFSRRIQSVINFSIPGLVERRVLWKNALNGISEISKENIEAFAKDYKISGGSIKNVIQYSWLLSKRKNIVIS